MIGADDRLALPPGVELRDGCLHDVVRLTTVPLNATGRLAVTAPTPRAAARALERRFAVDRGAALADVLGFCAQLNARFLLNVNPRRGRLVFALRWVAEVPFLLPLGRVPTLPTVRRAVDPSSPRSLAHTSARALAPVGVALFAAATATAALVLAALAITAPFLAVAAGAAVAGSVLVHELAHVVALRGVPACVVTRGFRVAIVHRAVPPRRTKIVALAGPAAGLAAALSLLVLVATSASAAAATAALVSLLNALGLTVLARDGRTLCAS